ncbi:regulator of deoxyribodipyrimidine photo-lyase PHR1 [Metarhizium album ARSEF 1941]|uniref:[histone H3]-trimethyl-L-lysine(9) demethylase n=1 Tax=Metarhizium album (strain ARSEF 1941) TaxID=1081103 RepID=A0A0B2WY39_METAS|nr:regulator of deoxyribodipyrimidine photo-lyase PHR1 [Metarhizium album ARSEF 1941]KHN98322.1 regulator of deoxyribodipyrimidine photo-lyase PHR1 [Metarhizium album ARSEF 1941]
MSTDVVSDAAPLDPGAPASQSQLQAQAPSQAPGPSSSSDPQPTARPAPTSASNQHVTDSQVQMMIECAKPPAPVFLNSPPDSNNATKSDVDASDSELSDLDEEPTLDDAPSAPTPEPAPQVASAHSGAGATATATAATTSTCVPAPSPTKSPEGAKQQDQDDDDDDIGEVLPDDWSGAVPIFRPTWHQFKDFQKFMKKVDRYGMKSGIIKIIPPKEWKDAQPPLDELVKHIRVREPIKQDIMGSNGTYRQVNILHGRSYNVPQWRQLCEQSEHQPPARRGERRANADKPKPARPRPAAPKDSKPSTSKKRGRGRPAKNKAKKKSNDGDERPMTPISPKPEPDADPEEGADKLVDSIEQELGEEVQQDGEPLVGRIDSRMGGAKLAKPKTQSVSARRKYSRREGSTMIDEAAFKDFDYRMDISDFTPERCEELERAYWKTLTYAAPLYGADMMGTLFDDRTGTWNLNKLPNLLDVLGTKIPGVNTAYLYLGMWKATFAWHLEDVDLYSINYLHFGAPKQWYSISQADARRFEGAMKSVWPADAKACNQFLRHKGFLISPHHLLQHYGIKVNKVVSYPGEFVVTYPYGYHSGYNLGYNCAEAVNFALDSWLEMGKIAKRCECAQAQDSVWINVYEIERKLRGEETEYEETEDDDDDDDDEDLSGLPTPPAINGAIKDAIKKRKRGAGEDKARVKRIRLRLKAKMEPPCCLCPNDIPHFDVLPTDEGRKAHKLCGLYIPETYMDSVDGKEVICNVGSVHKDRLNLKCLLCRSRRGACFQCSHQKCARAYHATCAAAAGVFVEDQDIPVFAEDGTEYKEQAFEFTCRFHRVRRDKKTDGSALEMDVNIRSAAKELKTGEICQLQYLKGEIFAGVIVENRLHDETLLIDLLPQGGQLEVEWKWLVLPDPADYHLPKASAKALPMPASRKAKDKLNTKRLHADKPRKDDLFCEGYRWAEFESCEVSNKGQSKVDLTKPDQIWHYLGKTSTEARAQYTEDLARQRHNPKGNFLDTIPKPPRPAAPISRPICNHQSYIAKAIAYSYSLAGACAPVNREVSFERPRKPWTPSESNLTKPATFANQDSAATNTSSVGSAPTFHAYNHQTANFRPQSAVVHGTPQNQSTAHVQSTQHIEMPQVAVNPLPQSRQSGYQQPLNAPSGQQGKPLWQVHSSVYQKYPFFRVNYNRYV